MNVNLAELRKRSDFINEQKHPTLDLLIWNYNQKCQFEKAWDDYTLMCRGLITDLEGNIVARPFKKFFNIEEKMNELPTERPIISEKFDGSLGIQYYDGDKVCIATRGSFQSEQAKLATNWMGRFTSDDFFEGCTYLWEIIYPENRIVVDYGKRAEMVLLAIIHTDTGEEIPHIVEEEAKELAIPYAKRLEYTDLEKVIAEAKSLPGNSEGYVFHWPEIGLRMKIKGEEYVRLHRLITGFSTKSIWECLMNGQDIDQLLEKVPDEFFNWVKGKKALLIDQYSQVCLDAMALYEQVKNLPDRKSQAIAIQGMTKKYSGIVFSLLDNKPVDKMVWRLLKPKFELPFKEIES